MPYISWGRASCLSGHCTVALSRKRAPTSKPIPTTKRCTSTPTRPSAHWSAACRYVVDLNRCVLYVNRMPGLGQESFYLCAARELPHERLEAGHSSGAFKRHSVSTLNAIFGPTAYVPAQLSFRYRSRWWCRPAMRSCVSRHAGR